MGIPAENERSFVSFHVLETDDEILQKTVKHMPAMDVAIGIWRAIMKKIFIAAIAVFIHFFVKMHIFPMAKHLWFLVNEVGSHFEASTWH